MRVLWIATKPPWPAVDGGRLVQWLTLEALAAAGVETTLVAPVPTVEEARAASERLALFLEPRLVVARPMPTAWTLLLSRLERHPFSVRRHTQPRVAREAARLLSARRFDVIHVEQVQALRQVPATCLAGELGARSGGRHLPVVLRAQNVESDIWSAVGAVEGGVRGLVARSEARRFARYERRAVRAAAIPVAFTREDAVRLAALAACAASEGSGGENERPYPIEVVSAPFPRNLPGGDRELAGSPAVVFLGSPGWLPNHDAASWFREQIWPQVAGRNRGAWLHVFGEGFGPGRDGSTGATERLTFHPSPRDLRTVFARGSIMVVPLRIASGIRMKILEAWSRGVPVVATSIAARGLDATDGRELLLADDPQGFAEAVARLTEEPGLAERLVARGRARLAERHDPGRVAEQLIRIYREAAGGEGGGQPDAR